MSRDSRGPRAVISLARAPPRTLLPRLSRGFFPSLSQPRLRQQLVHSRSGVHECEPVWVPLGKGESASGGTGTQGGGLSVSVGYACGSVYKRV